MWNAGLCAVTFYTPGSGLADVWESSITAYSFVSFLALHCGVEGVT